MSRGIKWITAIAFALVGQVATGARADVSVEEGGAVLVFPKVLNTATRTTLIEMSNSGNTLLHLHCFYTDARPLNPQLPLSPQNPPIWQEVDFFLWLTRMQPTAWLVGDGRSLNPGDGSLGFDPGFVPPVGSGFTGELMCIETDTSGQPIGANKLTGDATLLSPSGDSSRYAGIAIQGGELAGQNGRTLELDNQHYNSCPETLILNHFASGAVDPVVGPPDNFGPCATNCGITTELTLVPCQRDFENQIPGHSTINVSIINEFEERLSANISVTCWLNATLNQISGAMSANVLGSLTAQSRLVASGSGVLGVAEETHRNDAGVTARAAWNLQTEGSFFEPSAGRNIIDTIVIPGFGF